MSFTRLSDILRQAEATELPFWHMVLLDDMEARDVTEEESVRTMRSMLRSMKEADRNYDADLRSFSGLSGGDGEKLEKAAAKDSRIMGPFLASVMARAVKMAESNACMQRIVAAPTAGSCGVIPAVLLTYEEQFGATEEKLVEALYVAAGIGEVIAARASISGAEGGCQAEIGSASAMAAGALSHLLGGSGEMIAHAAALALKNMLGLTCDPVAGLVEVPCVKRNVSGAVNAVAAEEMVRAGLRSRIPPDEVIDAMRRTGRLLPDGLRETAMDGLAATPTGQKIKKKLLQE
ncbi:MAG: L-serine ammonia-lyase, iron-sulfur-dependent, subunit alpha [Lachnospiraceae bacterium]|nr:L-serine ammonia-lyase, iron-sulfur-dependent, subunit alpha [Lachnospiraceae bacterium]